ncbi:MAG: Rrf2 family transcriptional regulator, partial [Armatimonadetes bacterium]|nr:Rrf2 family transcriptional regulator [Armatimonadota bacterium]
IPVQFASNIFTRLSKEGLLRAHRGAKRGYTLARPAKKISLLDVIEAYEGPIEKPWCLLNRERACSDESPCALHSTWQDLREHVQKRLAKISLASLAGGD